jgi:small redox-active disulfide protein 2
MQEYCPTNKEQSMLIQVLGTGCAQCTKLAVHAEEAAKKAGIEFTLEKVSNINEITAMGVMTTPALVVEGKLQCSGKVPSVEQIIKMLQSCKSA